MEVGITTTPRIARLVDQGRIPGDPGDFKILNEEIEVSLRILTPPMQIPDPPGFDTT